MALFSKVNKIIQTIFDSCAARTGSCRTNNLFQKAKLEILILKGIHQITFHAKNIFKNGSSKEENNTQTTSEQL